MNTTMEIKMKNTKLIVRKLFEVTKKEENGKKMEENLKDANNRFGR